MVLQRCPGTSLHSLTPVAPFLGCFLQYLHRSGRAGRLGRKGTVWSILPPEQEFVLERLLNQLRLQAKCLGRQPPPREPKTEEPLQASSPADDGTAMES